LKENIMKKLILSLLLAATAAASAAPLDLIIGSSTTGTFYSVAQELKPLLEKRGWEVNIKVNGNCVKSQEEFQSTAKPAIEMLFNAYTVLPECSKSAPTANTWLINLTESQLALCARPGMDVVGAINAQQRTSIGSVTAYPKRIVLSLNPNFQYVPYASSGDLARGFLAGDVDIFITNMLRASKLVADGKARCTTVTGTTRALGAPAATQLFPTWSSNNTVQYYALTYKNLTPEQSAKLKRDLQVVLGGEEWAKFAEKSGYTLKPTLTPDEFNRSSKAWVRE
jgi:hypothetical protein